MKPDTSLSKSRSGEITRSPFAALLKKEWQPTKPTSMPFQHILKLPEYKKIKRHNSTRYEKTNRIPSESAALPE